MREQMEFLSSLAQDFIEEVPNVGICGQNTAIPEFSSSGLH